MNRKIAIFSVFMLVVILVSSGGFAEGVQSTQLKIDNNLTNIMLTKNDNAELEVIVVFKKDALVNKTKDLVNLLTQCEVIHQYENLPALFVRLQKSQVYRLAQLQSVVAIEYNDTLNYCMDTAKLWFGTEKASNDFSLDGDRDGNPNVYTKDDVVIAVLDSGIDANHVDLDNGKVIAWKDFINGDIEFDDDSNPRISEPYDDNSHGTHVAGIIAGEGEGNSAYAGVARGAALIGLKVGDANGACPKDKVLAAVDWCITNKDTYGIDIMNLSIGYKNSSENESLTTICNTAVDNGIVVVVAAGNFGPFYYTITCPGTAQKVITVGSMYDVGENGFAISGFSSRGPVGSLVKPDICAPGSNITAPLYNSNNMYCKKSGTSMASPFVAGTVALMLDANPNLTPSEVKKILATSAEDWGVVGKDNNYGYGRLDAYKAIAIAGNYLHENFYAPNHYYISNNIEHNNEVDKYEVNITDNDLPISITCIMHPGQYSRLYKLILKDPLGNIVAETSTGDDIIDDKSRKSLDHIPEYLGNYILEVHAKKSNINYMLDISAGASSVILIRDAK